MVASRACSLSELVVPEACQAHPISLTQTHSEPPTLLTITEEGMKKYSPQSYLEEPQCKLNNNRSAKQKFSIFSMYSPLITTTPASTRTMCQLKIRPQTSEVAISKRIKTTMTQGIVSVKIPKNRTERIERWEPKSSGAMTENSLVP